MNDSLAQQVPTFFGLALSTHRVLLGGAAGGDSTTTASMLQDDVIAYFPHEAWIAAVSIAFFRSTVRLQGQEPAVLRWFFCGLLAALAFTRKSYELITAVEIFSYAVSWLILRRPRQRPPSAAAAAGMHQSARDALFRLLSIAAGAVLSMLISHAMFSSSGGVPSYKRLVTMWTPSLVRRGIAYLFPVAEMTAAYEIMRQLALEPEFFEQMIQHLFFVTFHIQVGMGFLGIDFLRAEQSRRNQLIRLDVMENEKGNGQNGSKADESENGDNKRLLEKSRLFQRGAAPFSKYRFDCY